MSILDLWTSKMWNAEALKRLRPSITFPFDILAPFARDLRDLRVANSESITGFMAV